ncbi:unannotated protein [freshwater metagenome]|uniref:Unannotated protein n=1 Tax=freshwater metagenome TaxID=449393 RepID=A0A6J6Z703_9ZZZZ
MSGDAPPQNDDPEPFEDDLFDEYEDDEDDEYEDDDRDAGDETESPFRQRPPIETARALRLLEQGEISIIGRMPRSSNATFLVDLEHDGLVAQGIYKPAKGERPLWDFPSGLYRREVAAFDLSEQLGWHLVPPTVVRDGPLGDGSLQLFVPADFQQHYFTIRDAGRHVEGLQQLCVLDIMSNNTDRKGGHVLLDPENRIWAIDNGLSFHAEFKLRTVIWDFGGQAVPRPILDAVVKFLDDGLSDVLAEKLDVFERDAVLARSKTIVQEGRFPIDHTGRRYPWPLV